MRKVMIYKAEDGTSFDTEKECKEYEHREAQIKTIIKMLEPLPIKDCCDFRNGAGYIQQDCTIVNKAMIEIVKLSGIKLKDYKKFLSNPFAYRYGMIGRILSDSSENSLHSVWCRFMAMDENYKEWGQPYFARNAKERQEFNRASM